MKRHLVVYNSRALQSNSEISRSVSEKFIMPLLKAADLVKNSTELTLRYFQTNGKIFSSTDDCGLTNYKRRLGFRIPAKIRKDFLKKFEEAEHLFMSVEGVSDSLTVVVLFVDASKNCFTEIAKQNDALRLEAFDLPPIESTLVTSPEVRRALYQWLGENYRKLFSINAHLFLNSTHILESLFGHLGSISSEESISYVDKVRKLGDHFRSWMEPRIYKLQKNHHELWGDYYGERISFLDGGMSKLIGIPSVEPTGIRVGTYTVVPGEENPEKREIWSMESAVIGVVLSDLKIIEDAEYRTDTKRLQEATRYLLEPLSLLLHSMNTPPAIGLLHGPLQNQFQQYGEGVSLRALAGAGRQCHDNCRPWSFVDRPNPILRRFCSSV